MKAGFFGLNAFTDYFGEGDTIIHIREVSQWVEII
jgi:hypothetical protein